jgi:hypothetical protein
MLNSLQHSALSIQHFLPIAESAWRRCLEIGERPDLEPFVVLAYAALSLRILRPNGILIWDDYQLYDFVDRPGPAIDAVLALHQGKLEVLHKGYQVIARKAHA